MTKLTILAFLICSWCGKTQKEPQHEHLCNKCFNLFDGDYETDKHSHTKKVKRNKDDDWG